MNIENGQRTLTNTVAIITGASSGLGAETAEILAEQGVKLLLTGRNAEVLENRCNSLTSRTDAKYLVGDITDPNFCQQIIQTAIAEYGEINFLVNNAGVISRGSLETTTNQQWQHLMATNVDAVFYLCRAAIPHLQVGSSIVNIASTVSNLGAENLVGYCTSKGAIANFTKALAIELATRQITVNAIAPGAMATPMLTSGHPDGTTPEMVIQNNASSIPQGRIADPIEVARGIKFLLQETHLTGTILAFDGGYTAQ